MPISCPCHSLAVVMQIALHIGQRTWEILQITPYRIQSRRNHGRRRSLQCRFPCICQLSFRLKVPLSVNGFEPSQEAVRQRSCFCVQCCLQYLPGIAGENVTKLPSYCDSNVSATLKGCWWWYAPGFRRIPMCKAILPAVR